MTTHAPPPKDGRRRKAVGTPIDEAIGRYVLHQPLLRSLQERPVVAALRIVLGMAVVIAVLIGPTMPWGLVLWVGLATFFGARLLARRRRRNRPSNGPSVHRRTRAVNPLHVLIVGVVSIAFLLLRLILGE
jgi:hypothetical protein